MEVRVKMIGSFDPEKKKQAYKQWKPYMETIYRTFKKENNIKTWDEFADLVTKGKEFKDRDKFARWALWHAMPFEVKYKHGIEDLTDGMNEAIQDTILRKIVKELG